MSRKGDQGHYERGNVFIQPFSENVREAQSGKPKSETTKAKMRQAAISRMAHSSLPSRNKAVYAGGVLYESLSKAGVALGVGRTTVLNRIKRGWEGYKYK
jgi:hypothetical protein